MIEVSSNDIFKKYCSVKQFCEIFGIGRTSCYKLLAEGKISAVKFGDRTLIEIAQAEKYFKNLPLYC
ncbi:helix-turn-helix domain-containing protein [Acetobacter sacchari]|uniref:Helix-turn-helix domain-containing protein n=2 Tax=Acetobacter sacchari TaxID=2661687 RepID=A0ABS3M0G1_9PROT|nr:helix-turn-helix domain-containing protein [Acetobacter sacchari]